MARGAAPREAGLLDSLEQLPDNEAGRIGVSLKRALRVTPLIPRPVWFLYDDEES